MGQLLQLQSSECTPFFAQNAHACSTDSSGWLQVYNGKYEEQHLTSFYLLRFLCQAWCLQHMRYAQTQYTCTVQCKADAWLASLSTVGMKGFLHAPCL